MIPSWTQAPPSDAPRVATVSETIPFKFSLIQQTESGFEEGGDDCIAYEHSMLGDSEMIVFQYQGIIIQ